MISTKVASSTLPNVSYSVTVTGDGVVSCSCKGYRAYRQCKHSFLVKYRLPKVLPTITWLIDQIKLNQPTIETKQDLVDFIRSLPIPLETKLIINTFRLHILTVIWKQF